MGFWIAAILLALRLMIGFHFVSEGWKKIENPRPFSYGFFSNAKGPLRPLYRSVLWDPDGRARLAYAVNERGGPALNTDIQKAGMEAFVTRAGRYYGFQADHDKIAADKLKLRKSQLDAFFGEHRDEIIEYFGGLARRDQMLADPAYQQLNSLWGQSQTLQSDLAKESGPWLKEIDAIWSGLEWDMHRLGGELRAPLKAWRPGRRFGDTETMDAFVPFFDLSIGVCLVFGLFVRPAAVLGALFLGSIALSQWPWAPGAATAWYQWVESMAMLTLAATAAGRFCGVDGVLRTWRAAAQARRSQAAAAS